MVGTQVYKCCLNYLKSTISISVLVNLFFIKLQLVSKHSLFSQESKINFSETNDVLAQALGTSEYTGHEQGKGKYYMGKERNTIDSRASRVSRINKIYTYFLLLS